MFPPVPVDPPPAEVPPELVTPPAAELPPDAELPPVLVVPPRAELPPVPVFPPDPLPPPELAPPLPTPPEPTGPPLDELVQLARATTASVVIAKIFIRVSIICTMARTTSFDRCSLQLVSA